MSSSIPTNSTHSSIDVQTNDVMRSLFNRSKPSSSPFAETKEKVEVKSKSKEESRQEELIRRFENVFGTVPLECNKNSKSRPAQCLASQSDDHSCQISSQNNCTINKESSFTDPNNTNKPSAFYLLENGSQKVFNQIPKGDYNAQHCGLRPPINYLRYKLTPKKSIEWVIQKKNVAVSPDGVIRIALAENQLLDGEDTVQPFTSSSTDSVKIWSFTPYVLLSRLTLLQASITQTTSTVRTYSIHMEAFDSNQVPLLLSNKNFMFVENDEKTKVGTGAPVEFSTVSSTPSSSSYSSSPLSVMSTSTPKNFLENSYPDCWTEPCLAWWNYPYESIQRTTEMWGEGNMEFYKIKIQSDTNPGCAHSLLSFWCIFFLLRVISTENKQTMKSWSKATIKDDIIWNASNPNFIFIRCTLIKEYWNAFQVVFYKMNPFVDLSKSVTIVFTPLNQLSVKPSFFGSSKETNTSVSLQIGMGLQWMSALELEVDAKLGKELSDLV